MLSCIFSCLFCVECKFCIGIYIHEQKIGSEGKLSPLFEIRYPYCKNLKNTWILSKTYYYANKFTNSNASFAFLEEKIKKLNAKIFKDAPQNLLKNLFFDNESN